VEVLVELAESAEREIALRRQLAVAENEALTDSLTELPNKRAFDDALTRMAAEAMRNGTELAAIFFDLDHFKGINDTYGHPAGDRILEAIGTLAPQTLRSADFVARYGGEEFVVLLSGSGQDEAARVAEKLRAAIESQSLDPVGNVTASFGFAVLPHDARGPKGLVRAADLALYSAKARGRNCVVSASH
jgi:diguanylate cyclase (GGDEF)-like protein